MGLALSDARPWSDEVLEPVRLPALRACEMGFSASVMAVDPKNCVVGCSTCANIYPPNAIVFPSFDAV